MNEPLRVCAGLLLSVVMVLCLFMVLTLIAPEVWGQADWTTGQAADSMDYTQIVSATDANYGALIAGSWRSGAGAAIVRATLMKPAHDLRTAGYTQDSVKIWIKLQANMDPDVTSDSCELQGYALRVPFGEGDNQGANADAGESSWNASEEGTNDWTTGGAQSTTNDRFATKICSLIVVGEASRPATWLTLTIYPPNITDDLWNNGIVIEPVCDVAFETMDNISDDNAVAADRPYWEGWETAPAAQTAYKRKRKN